MFYYFIRIRINHATHSVHSCDVGASFVACMSGDALLFIHAVMFCYVRYGVFPIHFWQWQLIERNMQLCLAGLKEMDR